MHSQSFALFSLRSWLFNSSYVQSKCKMTSRWVSFAISIWLYVWQEIRAGGCLLMPVLRSLLGTWSQCFSRQKTIKITSVHFFSCKIFIQTRIHTGFHTVLRKSVWFFIINIIVVIKNTFRIEIWPWRSLPQDPIEACAFGACLGRVSIYPRSAPVFMPYAEIFKFFFTR